MKLDKFMNSWFFRLCERLFQLIILNILTCVMIALGLGIFSFMPAMVTLILMIKSNNSETSVPLFKSYFKSFFKYYKKAELLSIFYLLVAALLVFNTYYFYCWIAESEAIYYVIAYYIWLVIDIIFIMAFVNACFVFVYFPHLSIKKTIMYSFKLLRAITWKALVLFAIIIAELYIEVMLVFLLPLILISLYCYFGYILLDNDYRRIIPEGYKSLDVSDDIEEESNRKKLINK